MHLSHTSCSSFPCSIYNSCFTTIKMSLLNDSSRECMSNLVILNLPDLLLSSLLIYNFSIFERRFGSRKFISHLIFTTVLTSLIELMVFAALNIYDISLGEMPSGLFNVIFHLYVSFYSTIPCVTLTKIMGVPVTGKTLNYILGLQIASSDVENIFVVGCAVLAGLLWRLNYLIVQNLIQVPRVVANTFDQLLGRFLDSTDSKVSLLSMEATLEIRRGERLGKLEQQMLAAAMQASRRMEITSPQSRVAALHKHRCEAQDSALLFRALERGRRALQPRDEPTLPLH